MQTNARTNHAGHFSLSRPSWRVLLLLSAASAGASGCSSYVAPSMEVADARVTDRTTEGLAIAFTIDAENSNEDALPLREAAYSVELDGQRVFTGVRSAEATLRRYGSQQFTLPAAVPSLLLAQLPMGAQHVRYRISGSVEYITPGAFAEVLFDTGVRRPTTSFQDEGVIDLTALPSPPPPIVLPPEKINAAPEPELPSDPVPSPSEPPAGNP